MEREILKIYQYCSYNSISDGKLLKHVVSCHKHSAIISFRFNYCGSVFKNASSYRSHKLRKHAGCDEILNELEEIQPELNQLGFQELWSF